MTTMQRFKAYFGMVPPADYEDDYIDDVQGPAYRADLRHDRGFDTEYLDEPGYLDEPIERGYDDRMPAYGSVGASARGGYGSSYGAAPVAHGMDRGAPMERLGRPSRMESARMESGRMESGRMESGRMESGRMESGRMETGRASTRMTRGALAIDSMERVFEEGSPLGKITTLRPRDYSEARTIGERFRDGNPVIMDLVEMSNEDAKRLVDFAAGLAFALRGAFDKVATKVFLLSPADIDVSPDDRRRIAETGFYNQN